MRSTPPVVPFLVVGEALVDEVRAADGSTTAHPGGSPANVAVGLARLGHTVRLLSELGEDRYGRLVRDHLEASGVTVDARPTPRTSTARADLAADGSADHAFDIAWTLDPGEPRDDARSGHLHTGSLATALAPGAAAVTDLVRRSRGTVTTSFDPNVRADLAGDRASAVAAVERLVALSDVVKASDEDVRWLYPQASPQEVADRWHRLGPPLVVVTRGGDGAVTRAGAGWIDTPPVPVEVADTVGAGDSRPGADPPTTRELATASPALRGAPALPH